MKGFLFLICLIQFLFVNSEDMCCETCTNEGTKKYYSIDTSHDRCGECCMAPENFTIFKRFETGLTEATVDHPCHELGYTEYEITETHGAAGYYMTLDKYKKINSTDNSTTDEGESTDKQTANHTRYYRSHSSKGLKGGHIAAIVLCCVAVVAAIAVTIGVSKGLAPGSAGAISNVSVDNSSSINKLNFNN